MLRRLLLITAMFAATGASASGQVDRKAKVENDRTKFRESATWVYNDLTQGIGAGKLQNKPVLVVLRCIP